MSDAVMMHGRAGPRRSGPCPTAQSNTPVTAGRTGRGAGTPPGTRRATRWHARGAGLAGGPPCPGGGDAVEHGAPLLLSGDAGAFGGVVLVGLHDPGPALPESAPGGRLRERPVVLRRPARHHLREHASPSPRCFGGCFPRLSVNTVGSVPTSLNASLIRAPRDHRVQG